MNERKNRGDRSPPHRPTEGVRIIRADEAQAALDAGEAAGRRPDGVPVHLADLWPSPEEVTEAIRTSLTSEMFRRRRPDPAHRTAFPFPTRLIPPARYPFPHLRYPCAPTSLARTPAPRW